MVELDVAEILVAAAFVLLILLAIGTVVTLWLLRRVRAVQDVVPPALEEIHQLSNSNLAEVREANKVLQDRLDDVLEALGYESAAVRGRVTRAAGSTRKPAARSQTKGKPRRA